MDAFAVSPVGHSALQFPVVHPAVVSVIAGANAPQQVRANLDAFAAVTPAAFWAELKAQKLLALDAPVPG